MSRSSPMAVKQCRRTRRATTSLPSITSPSSSLRQSGFGCALMSPRPSWTEGPFTTEARARESLQWQFAVPVIEKAVSVETGRRDGQNLKSLVISCDNRAPFSAGRPS